MATLVLLEGAIEPQATARLKAFFVRVLADTRGYAGCQSLQCYVNEQDRLLVIVQRWDSRKHYEDYLSWRKETGVFGELESLLDGPVKIRFCEELAV